MSDIVMDPMINDVEENLRALQRFEVWWWYFSSCGKTFEFIWVQESLSAGSFIFTWQSAFSTFCLTHGVHSRYLSNVAVLNKVRTQNTRNSYRSGGFSVPHCWILVNISQPERPQDRVSCNGNRITDFQVEGEMEQLPDPVEGKSASGLSLVIVHAKTLLMTEFKSVYVLPWPGACMVADA